MNSLYIIAEAAQGYEGSVEISKLLIRSAKAAKANAIKFQVIYVDDLAEEGYEYYDLFKSLEISLKDWSTIRDFAKTQGIDFIIDVFGQKSFELAETIKPDGVKIHSTCFFDERLINKILNLDTHVYLSIGGIHLEEVKSLMAQCRCQDRDKFTIFYGFQAEPTPLNANHLLRIQSLRQETGINNIGFMDHSDGQGNYTVSLSAVALGLGVKIFEKHITLDRYLKMEDYVSALNVTDFASYVTSLHALNEALGSANLSLKDEEVAYRKRAIKRVVATQDLPVGTVVSFENIRLSRPKKMEGVFKISEVMGKTITRSVFKGEAIKLENI